MEQIQLEQSSVPAEPKKKLAVDEAEWDDKIWRSFASHPFFTVDLLSEFLGINRHTVQKRLNKFCHRDIHYLNRQRESEFHEWVYFPAPKGGNICFDKGYTTRPYFIREKAPSHLEHDVFPSRWFVRLHFALQAIAKTIEWEQWPDDMIDMKPRIPDWRFAVQGESEFTPCENQRTRAKNGHKYILEKMDDYDEMGIKRVCWFFKTAEKRKRILESAAARSQANTHHWFTTYELALSDPLGKIWLTPKNYENRVYSLLKPEAA